MRMQSLFMRRIPYFLWGFIAGLFFFSFYKYSIFSSDMTQNSMSQNNPMIKTQKGKKDKVPFVKFDELNKEHDRFTLKDDKKNNDSLFKEVRVLCWIMTQPQNLDIKAIHVKLTWTKRCNKVLFASDYRNDTFPTIDIKVDSGRNHLTEKTFQTFDYIHSHHLQDADWFLKADDDSYVIMENLRYFLFSHSPDEPVHYGHLFGRYVKQGYFQGGAGYVLSKEALKRFGSREHGKCNEKYFAEDVEMGRCLESLGIMAGDSRDSGNKTRFHPFRLYVHLNGNYPAWFNGYNKYETTSGPNSISDYPISFHYVPPKEMYNMEYIVYHLKAYGVK